MISTTTNMTQIPVRSLALGELSSMKSTLCLAAVTVLLCGGMAHAASPGCAAPSCAAPTCAAPTCAAPTCAAVAGALGTGGDYCDPCGDGCGRGRGPRYEGLDPYFSCGCNGSYKFPVPPLYTYHWPGMYSAQLMTDYHSPWRFPPLKPYVDEVPPVEMGHRAANSRVRSASASIEIESRPAGEMEPLSSKLLRGGR
jgi:hypothetical protein